MMNKKEGTLNNYEFDNEKNSMAEMHAAMDDLQRQNQNLEDTFISNNVSRRLTLHKWLK